jgi:hypothetical protein
MVSTFASTCDRARVRAPLLLTLTEGVSILATIIAVRFFGGSAFGEAGEPTIRESGVERTGREVFRPASLKKFKVYVSTHRNSLRLLQRNISTPALWSYEINTKELFFLPSPFAVDRKCAILPSPQWSRQCAFSVFSLCSVARHFVDNVVALHGRRAGGGYGFVYRRRCCRVMARTAMHRRSVRNLGIDRPHSLCMARPAD